MVTPVTATGDLDESAVERLVDFLLAGGVDGIFVVGTTRRGCVCPALVSAAIGRTHRGPVQRRAMVYAGIGDAHPDDVAVGNDYFHAGMDVAVALLRSLFRYRNCYPGSSRFWAGWRAR